MIWIEIFSSNGLDGASNNQDFRAKHHCFWRIKLLHLVLVAPENHWWLECALVNDKDLSLKALNATLLTSAMIGGIFLRKDIAKHAIFSCNGKVNKI